MLVTSAAGGRRVQFREPRAGWVAFLWLWAIFFGGVPLLMLGVGAATGGGAPVAFLLLFPLIAFAVLVPTRRTGSTVRTTPSPTSCRGARSSSSCGAGRRRRAA